MSTFFYLFFLFLFFFIGHLLQTLYRTNPFDRVPWHREYTIHHWQRRFTQTTICFTKYATQYSLRTALHDSFYQKPTIKGIEFENFPDYNVPYSYWEPFFFETLSFLEVDSSILYKRCSPFDLPCSELILPKDTKKIHIDTHIPHICAIFIDLSDFIPLVHYYGEPIPARHQINFIVPKDILQQYLTDPCWSSLQFIDDNKEIFSPTFNGIKPRKKAIDSSMTL